MSAEPSLTRPEGPLTAADVDAAVKRISGVVAPTPLQLSERLSRAIAAGECPSKPDEADDLTAHRALLHARARYLAAN